MVDFAGVVLADSISGACLVADCLAFVDSISYRWYCRGGVSCAAQGHFIFAREITRPSLTRQTYSVQRTAYSKKQRHEAKRRARFGNLQILDNECRIVNRSGESSSVG